MKSSLRWSPTELLAVTQGRLVSTSPPGSFSHVTIDGRLAQPGSLFVALRGPTHDGHTFVPQAVAQGAQGILVEPDRGTEWVQRFPALTVVEVSSPMHALSQLAAVRRRSPALHSQLQVIGITGSYGKTTTKNMLAALLRAHTQDANTVLATEGNLNNHLGVPLTLLQLQPYHRFAVIEMGMSNLGEIAQLAHWAAPHMGLVTSVGPAHLAQLGSLENIARAKGELFHALPDGGWAVYPGGEEHRLIQEQAAQAGVRTGRLHAVPVGANDGPFPAWVALQEPPQISATGTDVRFACMATPTLPAESIVVHIPLVGGHHVHNASLALATARVLGVKSTTVQQGMMQMVVEKHRGQVLAIEERIVVDDCYNANPTSMRAAIQALPPLKPFSQARLWLVLGDMLELGPNETAFHTQLGGWITQLPPDQRPYGLLTLGARAQHIAQGTQHALPWVAAFDHIEPLAEALRQHTRAGDVVLLKGSRGMQLERILTQWGRKSAASTP